MQPHLLEIPRIVTDDPVEVGCGLFAFHIIGLSNTIRGVNVWERYAESPNNGRS